MIVSPNGKEISIIHKDRTREKYSYEELRKEDYIKKYNYAAKFVLKLRRGTPKYTNNDLCDRASCVLMDNDPDPDFKMEFYDEGVKPNLTICYRHDQKENFRIVEPGLKEAYFDEKNLPFPYRTKLSLFLEKKEEMLRREHLLRINGFSFPITEGRRPARMRLTHARITSQSTPWCLGRHSDLKNRL
jgi:hypothetical protein